MSGSGGNPLKGLEQGVRDTARKWRNDPWGSFVKTFTDLSTGGLARYENGKWNYGSTLHRGDEIIGELSGRNKARLAQYKAEDDIEKAKTAAKNRLDKQRLQEYRNDLMASRTAQATRASSMSRETTGRRTMAEADTERDFLGL